MAPMNHLHAVNPQIDLEEHPNLLLTEAIAFRMRESITLNRGENITGCIGCALVSGVCHEDKIPLSEPLKDIPDKIAYWPGGGGFLDEKAQPRRGYEIIGTWDGW